MSTTARQFLAYANENLVPCYLDLCGKSPNLFFEDVFNKSDEYVEK